MDPTLIEGIQYNIDPIKKVEGAVESAATTTTTIIRENTEKSTENAKKLPQSQQITAEKVFILRQLLPFLL